MGLIFMSHSCHGTKQDNMIDCSECIQTRSTTVEEEVAAPCFGTIIGSRFGPRNGPLKSHIFDRVWACQGVPCGDQRSRLEHFLDQSGAKQRSECNSGNAMLPSGAEIQREAQTREAREANTAEAREAQTREAREAKTREAREAAK